LKNSELGPIVSELEGGLSFSSLSF